MRTECRKEKQINIETIHGYHRGDYEKTGIFVSDRMTETGPDYRLPDGGWAPVYGIEMETQNWGINNREVYATILKKVCFSVFPANLWKCEDDCSIRRNADTAAECITQPMTKAFIRNHYQSFKAMFDTFPLIGTDNARTGDCGQHVHINVTCFGRSKKVQDEAIRKLYYIVNKHYNLMLALLYRPAERQGYCGRMDPSVAWNMNLNMMSGSHGISFNGEGYSSGHVELRIPGGQKNYACFRNTMESVFQLVEASKTISRRDCDDVTKIFAGCNQHVFDRLKTYCLQRGTITPEQLDAIRATVKTVDFN